MLLLLLRKEGPDRAPQVLYAYMARYQSHAPHYGLTWHAYGEASAAAQTDKRYQLADWRVRPLPKEMQHYARLDTHYLLYIHDCMKVLSPATALPQRQSGLTASGQSQCCAEPSSSNISVSTAGCLQTSILYASVSTWLRLLEAADTALRKLTSPPVRTGKQDRALHRVNCQGSRVPDLQQSKVCRQGMTSS